MLYTYPAIIHNDADGLWLEFIDFNCTTHAENLQDLLSYAQEAMECHILGLLEHGEKIPIAYTFTGKDTMILIQSDIDYPS